MKQLMRLLIVALVAGGVATIIVQRDRLREIDREELATQIREGIQSMLKRGEEAAEETADEVDAALESVADEAAPAADAIEEASENSAG